MVECLLCGVKKSVLFFIVILLSAIVFAHEFWLQPRKFYYSIREMANIKFLVGENFTGENWMGNKDKIQELFHFTPTENIIDISTKLSTNEGDSLQLPLQEEGTHMVTFLSTNSFVAFESQKSKAYLLSDGIENVEKIGQQTQAKKSNEKEYCQSSLKTIIQVGGKLTDQITKPSNLPLDIIPEENPYANASIDSKDNARKVKFKILFKTVPQKNTLVKIWYLSPKNRVLMDTVRTNKNGLAITNRHSGPFMVSCILRERNQKDTLADRQQYSASLVFEYPQYYNRNGLN